MLILFENDPKINVFVVAGVNDALKGNFIDNSIIMLNTASIYSISLVNHICYQGSGIAFPCYIVV